ncbi:MAG: AMP-binding protein [Rhodocyclaceae bacterium]|jgi:long-chain acyl-CoA synthetase|nr:AMP-binding protein [Rhodocyclaceae bacterium]
MNIAQLLAAAARTFPERPAVSRGSETRHSYRQLQVRVVHLAGGLLQLPGIAPRSRVVLYMGNCTQYVEVLFALWHAGLCAVPINAKLHPREAAFILENSDAALCLATDETAAAAATAVSHCTRKVRCIVAGGAEYDGLLDAAPVAQHPVQRDDLAWVFYTSGTTGRPKGAMLSHGNLLAMVQAYLCDVDQIDEFDALLHLGPQSHAAGLFCLAHIAKGGNQVLPDSGGFDVAETIDLINHYSKSTLFLAPTMLRRFIAAPELPRLDVSRVRTVLCGAAPIYPGDVRAALKVFGLRFWNGYGQGESPLTITAMPKHLYRDDGSDEYAERLVSVGIARTGVEVCVADADGNELPPGGIGEILVRGDVVMSGYLNDPQATAAVLAGGWLHTGDLGAFDARGFLYLKDRSKDLVISGGSNIYPREVEEALLASSAVEEVAVIGVPDPEWGESVAAFVVLRSGMQVTAAELDALCLDRLARYKRPKRYHFLDALPKSNYGKVLKTELRALISAKD